MPTFQHPGDLGDIVYALPTIKQLGGGKLYLTSGHGSREQMTDARIEAIKPLLLAQPYITEIERHKGEKTTYNFNGFRAIYHNRRTLAETQRMHVSPMQVVDFAKPWLTVDAKTDERPVFARSARYRNADWDKIWPDILDRYGDKAIFVGTKEEHEDFTKLFGKVEWEYTSNLLEAARIIAGAVLFVGNQSCPLAIAQGTGRPVIVEEHPRFADCHIVRTGARYIKKLSEWELGQQPTKLMIALQFWPGDSLQAMELAQLIVDLEPEFNRKAEFAVCVTREVSNQVAESVASIARQKFRTHIVRSTRFGRGWPNGCNDLWADTMLQLNAMSRNKQTDCQAVATIEPDCCPGRNDWINALRAEWDRVKEDGKLVLGSIVKGSPDHINGNAVFDIRIMDKFPQLARAGAQGWDCYHGSLLMKIGADTPLIVQRYSERRELTAEEVLAIRKEKAPAFIHGLKTSCGLVTMRRELLAS